jgi:hypothetical protein
MTGRITDAIVSDDGILPTDYKLVMQLNLVKLIQHHG